MFVGNHALAGHGRWIVAEGSRTWTGSLPVISELRDGEQNLYV